MLFYFELVGSERKLSFSNKLSIGYVAISVSNLPLVSGGVAWMAYAGDDPPPGPRPDGAGVYERCP